MHNPEAVVGKWYQDVNDGMVFEVVALDEDAIEVQTLDGSVSEFEVDWWQDFSIEPISPPKDWHSAYELSSEDRADSESTGKRVELEDPINGIEPEITHGLLDD